MLLIASINPDGDIDISPRGGPPGFVTVLDKHHIAFVSEMGNNKILTLSSVQENGRVGLMFIVPGVTDILRLYGHAAVTHEEQFILSLGGNLKRNKTAIRIEITKVFPHCSTALNRSGFWKKEMWPDKNKYKIPNLKDMAEGLAACRENIDEKEV
ncbi:MAG: putative pyridoxine 5'-phosphate oxidase superfamily flavin-nucleotide-binding protein [Arenicella sp.]|jgi:predicted pyridoxine 5'-phosphate oxidase superfamily flavin-nucleotide-binding protein